MPLRRIGQLALVALMMTLAAPVHAAPATVALVHDQNPNLLEQKTLTRLRAEISAAGFAIADIARDTEDARQAVEAEPPVPGVFATIVIVPRTPSAADVWVADLITGKTVVRRVHGGAGADNDIAVILAVRAVELLQASLLEAVERPASVERASRPSMPSDVAEWMQSPRVRAEPSFGLAIGVGVLHSLGGVGPAFLPVLGFSYRLTSDLALALRAGGAAFAPDLDAPMGSIAVRQKLAWLDLVYRLPLPIGRLTPLAMLGAGGYHLGVVGTAHAPYQGKSDDLWAALLEIGLGATFRLGARISLLGDIRMLVVTPKPIIRAAGDEVGNISQPSWLGEAAVDVAF